MLETETENIGRLIGKIPVNNLWLLMLYASELRRYIGSTKKFKAEDEVEEKKVNLDKIADLIAPILCDQVKKRLIRKLNHSYETKTDTLRRVRGRINVLTTESCRLLDKGKVRCTYDELTINTPRNRYVRCALEHLAKFKIEEDFSKKCKTLSVRMQQLGISNINPVNYSSKSEKFDQRDSDDKEMVAVADFVFLLHLPTESAGEFFLPTIDRELVEGNPIMLGHLFQKAITGFYKNFYNKGSELSVSSGKLIYWKGCNKKTDNEEILPEMRTDIIINRLNNSGTTIRQRLIIDTKFTPMRRSKRTEKPTPTSEHIYQIYAYVSQDEPEDKLLFSTIGMLLYPSVDKQDKDVNERAAIQEHPIWFCTVDLTGETTKIKERLQDIVNKAFEEQLC